MEASELIGRLEAASEGSRELDCYMNVIARRRDDDAGRFTIVGPPTYASPRFFFCPDTAMNWLGYDLLNVAPAYTTSIDAIAALIERKLPGWEWHALESPSHNDGDGCSYAGLTPPDETRARYPVALRGRRPALALCIALLGALQHQGEAERG